MTMIGLKPWVNPFGKCQFSTFWTSSFYSLERRFIALGYRKRHFPGLYRLKKKVEKMAIFGPKPWVNPLVKISISTFWTSSFYSLERRFFVLEYRKRHFLGLYSLKKKSWKNGHFSDQNHGLTPLEKCQFFDFLNFVLSHFVIIVALCNTCRTL